MVRHQARVLRWLADFDGLVDVVRANSPGWVIAVDNEVLARYTEAAGRSVTSAGIALYRRWWAFADVAAFADGLRRPHGDGEDAAAGLTYLTRIPRTATD